MCSTGNRAAGDVKAPDENAELRRANDILKAAAHFFGAELDRVLARACRGCPQVLTGRGWRDGRRTELAVAALALWKRSRVAALLLVLVVVVLAVVFFPVLFQHAGGQREVDMSWNGRLSLYRAVLDLVKEHPILGLGPAAYRHYGHTRWLGGAPGRALWLRPNISSHNNYLDVYAQMGLVGLGLFLWFLFEVGRLGWRLRPRFEGDFEAGYVYGVLGGLIGTLVAMMLADWFLPFVYNIGFAGFRTSVLAWMFLGGLVALAQNGKGDRR